MKRITLLLIYVGTALWAVAQPLSKRVSLNYKDEQLGQVLADITDTYDIRFSYSSDFVPVNQRVSVSVQNEPLSSALDNLLAQTPIGYVGIGDQIVLKVDQQKKAQLSKVETLRGRVRQTSPIYPERSAKVAPTRKPPVQVREVELLASNKPAALPEKERNSSIIEQGFEPVQAPVDYAEESGRRLAQVSLLPFLGTNAGKSDQLTNNFSVNLFWGYNGGVEGLEVGGLVNGIKNDVKGIQVAGIGNIVGQDVIGTQVGGLFNVAKGKVVGIQSAGLFNVSGSGQAVQAALFFNASRSDYAGIQAAGLYNYSKGKADGLQAAGLFNISNGKTKSQVAGLFNYNKGDITWGQIGVLFNKAHKVKGFQIGLINISDTITGTPLGVLNIVKKGYNRMEFSGGETMYANATLKLGARSFYNTFHLGARWEEVVNPGQNKVSWSLGYGIGTVIGLSKNTLINLEVCTQHINEKQRWTRQLNQLSQFKLLFDVRAGRRTSFFAGPTYNLMVSELLDSETGIYGSQLTPQAFFDKTSADGRNVKMWVGFSAGIRL